MAKAFENDWYIWSSDRRSAVADSNRTQIDNWKTSTKNCDVCDKGFSKNNKRYYIKDYCPDMLEKSSSSENIVLNRADVLIVCISCQQRIINQIKLKALKRLNRKEFSELQNAVIQDARNKKSTKNNECHKQCNINCKHKKKSKS